MYYHGTFYSQYPDKNVTLALLLPIFYSCFENINDDDMRLQLFKMLLNKVEAASAHHPWILLSLISGRTSFHKILIALQMILAIKLNAIMCKSKNSSEF